MAALAEVIPLDTLVVWLRQQRWFLEKQAPRSAFSLYTVENVSVSRENLVRWIVVSVVTKEGQIFYQIPLTTAAKNRDAVGCDGQGEYLVDAWDLPWFVVWFVSQWQGKKSPRFLKRWCGVKQWKKFSTSNIKAVVEGQSNQAFVLGTHYFLKVQRRLVPGLSVDVEMCRELRRRGSNWTIPLLASLDWRLAAKTCPLAQLSPMIPHQGSGWNWFIEPRLKPLTRQERLDCLAEQQRAATTLGFVTQQVHELLSRPSRNVVFAPKPVDLRRLRQRMENRLQHTVELVQALPHRLASEFVHVAQALLQKGWKLPAVSTRPAQRIHGDYHLGQTLRVGNEWRIMDFEGEPLRPVEERQAKDLPWRDVAGMVRSLEYGAAVLARKRRAFPIELLRQAFLDGYTMKLSEADTRELSQWLPHYYLEKALYEIEYELRSRPDWLTIPLTAAIAVLKQMK